MRNYLFLPFLLGLSLFVACVETDISVPGFPEMVTYFGTTEAMVQLTMSLNFLGLCLAGLFYGPLSDSFGRRPIMLFGNALFLVGAIGTATTTSIESLIAWRFLQGVGAAAALTIIMAIIADAYQGERAAQLVNRMNGSMTAVMAGAPLAGGFLVQSFGWRSTFSVVAILCLLTTVLVAIFLPETNQNRKPLKPKQIIRDFWQLLTDSDFNALSIGLTLQCAGYMAFVAAAVFVYVDRFHVSLTEFTLHQGMVIGVFSVVSLFGGQITKLFGTKRSMLFGLICNVFAGLSLWTMAVVGIEWALAYTLMMSIYGLGVALCYGVTFTASMELYPELKGATSSLIASMRLLIISLAIWCVGTFADGTFIPETTIILVANVIAAGLLGYAALKPRVSTLMA